MFALRAAPHREQARFEGELWVCIGHGKSCLLRRIHSAPSRPTSNKATMPLSHSGRSEHEGGQFGEFAHPELGTAGQVGDALQVVGAHVGVQQLLPDVANLEFRGA